jgi:hypothetical protein
MAAGRAVFPTPTATRCADRSGIRIVVGSVLFFGAIASTITGYFMRSMQNPHKRIIDTIRV